MVELVAELAPLPSPTPLLEEAARLRSLFPLNVPWRESSGQMKLTKNEQRQAKKNEQEPQERSQKNGRDREEERAIERKKGQEQEKGGLE